MLVAGSWLGLPFMKEEHFKLARILLDLPNFLDEEWHLDVRKAQATPPTEFRGDLLRIAKITRQKASENIPTQGKGYTARAQRCGYICLGEKNEAWKNLLQN